MSGLVGFITFPEGYKCTLFAPIPVKNPKARSALGPKDLTHDVGKNYLYFKYTMVYICDVSVSLKFDIYVIMPSINDLFVDLRSNIENLFFDLRHFP
jgi:hypothetical protein